MRLLIFYAACFTLSSCYALNKYAGLKIDKTNIVFLKPEKGDKATRLRDDDMVNIEAALNRSVSDYNNRIDTALRYVGNLELKNYKRQYVAYIDSAGKRKVWVNCFCAEVYQSNSNWKKKQVQWGWDGGICYFTVTINLTDKTYKDFMIDLSLGGVHPF